MLIAHAGANKLGRQDLLALPTPESTLTHQVVPHSAMVQSTIEALAYRKLEVVRDEYALTPDGMRMFGFLEIDIEQNGVRLGLGLRNSHDKSFALGMIVGFRTFVCDNLAFRGEFVAVSKRHSKNVNIEEVIALGVDKAQRHFVPLMQQIDAWRDHSLSDVRAKEVIYDAFIGGHLDAPKHLAREVHRQYFEPEIEEFTPRTLYSLQNAFTGALKTLEPVPQYKALASFGTYLDRIQ